MNMALEGIRVVELAAFMAGPVQATILGDYGAEIIKVERPRVGDPTRDTTMMKGMFPESDIPYNWENKSRNKKSVCIDLKSKEGQEIAHRLIETTDVFLSNVELVELDKFKLDYETLSKVNPRLVYAHSSTYGHEGPDARKRGFDMGAWSRSGIMLKAVEPGSPPPLNPIGLPDATTATFSALGIMLALYVRERTGVGQMVTNSILGSMLWTCQGDIGAAATTGVTDPPKARAEAGNPFYNRYKTKDDKWLILLRSGWHDSCETLGILELENDPRFDTYTHRSENNVELIAILDRAVATKTAQEWAAAFEGKDVIWSVAQTFLEAVHDPQTEANQYIVNYDHPKYGPMKLPGIPFRLSKTPPTVRTPAPELGQNTDEVIQTLGYNDEAMAKFKESGAIWPK